MIENNPHNSENLKNKEENVNPIDTFSIPDSVIDYFNNNKKSKLQVDTGRFVTKYLAKNPIDIDYTNIPENIDILMHHLSVFRGTRNEPEAALTFIKESGLIKEPVIKKTKKEKVIEHIDLRKEDIGFNIKEAKDTKLQKEKIQENMNFSELREVNIAGNKERVARLFENINTQETESLDYYMQFANITKGGADQVRSDFESLVHRKDYLENLKNNLDNTSQERIEHAKKIAAITEKGIDYAISNLDWYGPRVNMKETSQFSDIKRSVDNLLEISKDDEEKDFVGIATDVTFRRLEEKAFDGKYFKLLENIRDGYKTKVKYEKDSEGNMMKEFPVPKVLLHFEYSDIGMFMDILEKSNSESGEELKERYENSPQKIKYLQQIVHQCKILSSFAKKYKNNIFRGYDTIINSITELSWENKDIKEALETSSNNKVSQKLSELTLEFEKITNQL